MIKTVYEEPPLFLKHTLKGGIKVLTIHFVNDENELKGFAKAIPLSSRVYYDLELRNKLLQQHCQQ